MNRERWTPVLAALATTLTVWSMSPVVDGGGWWAPSLLMVLVVMLTGMGLRELRLPPTLVVAGQVAAGAVALTAVYAGGDAVLGLLPGPQALQTLGAVLRDGGDTIQRYQAPVPISTGLSLLVTGGVLVIALLVDVIAVTLRAPAAAGLPLLALYCVPAAVVRDGLSWRYFVAAALGWLVLLAHDAGDRVLRWGRLLPRWGSGAGSRNAVATDTGALSATGRRLGVAAIAVAVLVPSAAPGLSESLLTRGGSSGPGDGSGVTVINPILSLRDNLSPRQDVEVLRYQTDQQDVAPLRILTADRFDGNRWEPASSNPSRRDRATNGLPNPPGLSDGVARDTFQMRIDVGDVLNQDFLPLPYPTRKVDIDGRWLFDRSSLNVIGDGDTVRGKTYTAQYLAVRPTPAQLRAAPQPPSEIAKVFTALPRSLPVLVRDRARQVADAAGASTKYDQAMALQQWFRESGGFTYSTRAPVDAGGDAVAGFLVNKQGYCVQFSSAMAVMARALGIPARVAVGFLPGNKEVDNTYSVKLTDAHAWPELYFEGAGWVRFEPTPATRTGVAPAWATPQLGPLPTGGPTAGGTASGSTSSTNPPTQDSRINQLPGQEGATTAPAAAGAGGQAGGTGVDVPWRGVTAGLLVLALLALTPVTAVLARRRRRRAAHDERDRIEAAWGDLLEQVGDLGLALPAGSTPRQVGADLSQQAGLEASPRAQVALSRLSRLVERSRYARGPLATGDLDDDVRTVLAAVSAAATRGDRALALLLPRSGTGRLTRSGDAVGRRFGSLDQSVTRRLHDLRVRRPRLVRTRT